MSIDERLELLHKTLHGAGVDNEDVHAYLDWVVDHMEEQARRWLLRVVAFGAGGWTFGLLVGFTLCRGIPWP